MKFLHDTWLVFARSMGQSIRNPVWLFVAIFQPVLFLLLFGPLLKQLTQIRGFGGTNAYTVLVPGLVVQLGLYGAAFVGFGIIAELREGIIERMRVTPVSRGGRGGGGRRATPLLLGRSMRDVIVIIVQSAILVALSVPFGLSVSVPGAAIAILLVALLGLSLSALSNAVGLILQSEDALAPISNFFLVPVLLLSGILLPMGLAPTWLRRLSYVDPLRHTVDAARALFRGHLASGTVLRGFVVTGALAALCVWMASRQFRRSQA